jgi:quercetin dioxygenase-like cupin family protein
MESSDEPSSRNLRELLHYQEGSIVSRVVLKNPAGTVTVFAFDQGESLSEHTAPFDALVLILDGEAEIKIAGHEYRLREGESLIMPANRPHAVRAATKFKMLLVMIKG